MSARDEAVLWLLGRKGNGAGGAVAGGGNVLLKTPKHKLDGPEHAAPDDTTTLDATVDRHGLLPKLSGDAGDALRGDGSWQPTVAALSDLSDVDSGSPSEGQLLRWSAAVGKWITTNLPNPVLEADGTLVVEADGTLIWEW